MGKLSYKLVASDRELKAAFEVRRQVFVEEQGISEDIELDDYDREALHMVVKDGEKVIGTARVLFFICQSSKIRENGYLKTFSSQRNWK